MKSTLTISILSGVLAFGFVAACGTEDDPIQQGGTGGSGAAPSTGGTGGSGGTGGTGGTGGDPCVNTEETCDECVKWEENPSLSCSEFTAGCIPFDNAGRVPGFPNFPKVP